MFTGLIEEVGYLKNKRHRANLMILVVKAKRVTEDIKVGDSICVNGICLTVTNLRKDCFEVEVMKETIDKTNLKYMKLNEPLNLERALNPTSYLGGHIINGHIDSIGKIKTIEKGKNIFNLEIEAVSNVLNYLVEKGSIAVNGVSLTVGRLEQRSLWVYLIPETLKKTNLTNLKVGYLVNLEADILGKYVHKYVLKHKNKIDESLLIETGFIKGV